MNKLLQCVSGILLMMISSLIASEDVDRTLIEVHKTEPGVLSVVFLAKVEKDEKGLYVLGDMKCQYIKRWTQGPDLETVRFSLNNKNKNFEVYRFSEKDSSESSVLLERSHGKMDFDTLTSIKRESLVSEELDKSWLLIDYANVQLLSSSNADNSSRYVYIHLADKSLGKLKAAYPVVGFTPWYNESL